MRTNKAVKLVAVAFVATMAFGVGTAINASANSVAFDTLALADGASVRYGAEDGKNGLRYVLSIDKTDYQSLAANGYTDVSFGVLIAPEHYNDIYALNEENVFGANAKYCWNGEQAGKAEIFNLTGALVEDTEDATKMTFYGAVVDILDGDPVGEDNNIALDFRGVGYAKYTYNGEVGYKFVGDEDNVRSMAYVAQEVKDLPGVDAGMVQYLQTAYLDKVDWQLKAENAGETVVEAGSSFTVPTSVKALDNTFYADKYDVTWNFAGSAVEAGQNVTMPNVSGEYTLTATATRKTDAEDAQVVYTKTYVINAPTVNGKTAHTFGKGLYNVETGVCGTSATITQYFVDQKFSGDFVVEASITLTKKSNVGYMPGISINAGGGNRIAFKGLSGNNNLYINVSDDNGQATECYVTNFGIDVGGTAGLMKITVAKVDNAFYVYDKNGAFGCVIDATGVYGSGKYAVKYENTTWQEGMPAKCANFFAAGNENVVGIFASAYVGSGTYWHNVTATAGTEATKAYAIGVANVNGLATTSSLGSVAYVSNGVWKNADTATTTRQYYLNTVVQGDTDFVLEANTRVESKSGFGGWTGVSLGFAKGDRETASDFTFGKMYVDIKMNNYDIAIDGGKLSIYCDRGDGYGMTITVKGFSANIGGANLTSKMTVVRLSDVIYIYDNANKLVCTMTPDGVYGATEANTVTYSGQNQSWYVTNVGYTIFKGAPECVAGMYYEKYGDSYSTFQTGLTMTRGTAAANNKVNPTA